jgi:16S rRNA (guanine527-N7)-methyltransferase
VAPLERLTRWCLPLVRNGGRLLAVKGESAADEVARLRPLLERLGAEAVTVRRCGVGVVDPPAMVVEVVRQARSTTKGRTR